MKTKKTIIKSVVWVCVAFIVHAVVAADGVWSGAGLDNNWATTDNWLNRIRPSQSGNGNATFQNTNATEVNLDYDWSIYNLVISEAAAAPLTIVGSKTLTLTMGQNANAAVYLNNSTVVGAETSFRCPVVCSRSNCQYISAGCTFYDSLTILNSTTCDLRVFRNSANVLVDGLTLSGANCQASLYGPTAINLNYYDSNWGSVRFVASEGAHAVVSSVFCGYGSAFEMSGSETVVVVTNALKSCLGDVTALKNGSSVKMSAGLLEAGSIEVGGGGGRLLVSGGTLVAASVVNGASKEVPSRVSDAVLKVGDFNTTGDSDVIVSGDVVFDLSDDAALMALGKVKFESAVVTIALGDREVELGTRLVAWDATPEGVSFALTGTNVGQVQPQVRSTGLYFGKNANEAVTATWTGVADDGNIFNMLNWACTNSAGVAIEKDPVITAETALSFAGRLAFDWPRGTKFDHGLVSFGNCELVADCNWAGLVNGVGTTGLVVDLAGKKLTVSEKLLTTGTCLVTNSVGSSEFHFDVTEGKVFSNAVYRLAGDLRFFKEGKGEFWLVDGNNIQDHIEGTEIRDGVFGLPYSVMDTIRPFGMNYIVDVCSNGVLDINGACDWGASTGEYAKTDAYTFRLRGGTLKSTQELPSSRVLKSTIVLFADSTLVFGPQTYAGSFKLNGFRLSLTVSYGNVNKPTCWRASPTADDTGKMRLVEGNYLLIESVMPQIDLEVREKGAGLYIYDDTTSTVHDYYADYRADRNAGSGILNVTGLFTPACQYFFGCTLLNGSSIDLSGQHGAWKTRSSFAAGKNVVEFADGATITLRVGAREVVADERLIDWIGNEPENIGSVRFMFEGEFAKAHPQLKLKAEQDGVYARARGGLMMVVK